METVPLCVYPTKIPSVSDLMVAMRDVCVGWNDRHKENDNGHYHLVRPPLQATPSSDSN